MRQKRHLRDLCLERAIRYRDNRQTNSIAHTREETYKVRVMPTVWNPEVRFGRRWRIRSRSFLPLVHAPLEVPNLNTVSICWRSVSFDRHSVSLQYRELFLNRPFERPMLS